jgi:hypothetical protein
LLLLEAAVAPREHAAAPLGDALGHPAWRTPRNWRQWGAYVLTREGARMLLHESVLPMSVRAEAHASALVELGLLVALWSPEVSAGFTRLSLAPHWPPPHGDGGAFNDSVAHSSSLWLAPERRCDLCDLPAGYSRPWHVLMSLAPAAAVAFVAVHLLMRGLARLRGVS